jgi:hypothetical protein
MNDRVCDQEKEDPRNSPSHGSLDNLRLRGSASELGSYSS